MKKFTKIVILMIVVIFSLSMATFAVDATGGEKINPKDLLTGTDTETVEKVMDPTKTLGGTAMGIVQTVGMAAAILILAIYGLQWFIGGSQQKAGLKDKMWAYLIGALFCFAGPTLFNMLVSAVSGILN